MKEQQKSNGKEGMFKEKCVIAFSILLLWSSYAVANGALAIDSNQGDQYGFSSNYPSREGAWFRALQECRYGCSIVMEFSTGCAAYAADQAYGSGVYGWLLRQVHPKPRIGQLVNATTEVEANVLSGYGAVIRTEHTSRLGVGPSIIHANE